MGVHWRKDSLRHFFQQPAKPLHRLPHVKAFLHRPDAGRHGMHNRYLKIFFEQMNDVETAPAGAEHVDAVGLWML